MKVAIYDTQHFEMVNVIHNIFYDSSDKIAFFTSKAIQKKIINSNLGNTNFDIITLNKKTDILSFHVDCLNYIKKESIDLVLFNTIDTNYKEVWLFIKKIKIPFTVTIHNINTWLKPPFTLNITALEYYFYRHKILSKSSGIILQEELFINYIKKYNLYIKPIAVIPHTIREDTNLLPSNQSDHLKIAIPGAIDGNNRRDYEFCLNAIKKIYKINSNIEFKFLGRVRKGHGDHILNEILTLEKEGVKIKQFYNGASNELFDSEMRKCDIIFMPVKINFKYEGIKEIYGQTKVTGVLYDMMRFKKPGIVPIDHVVPPTMESSILTYKDMDDFIQKIIELEANKTKLTLLTKAADINSKYYSYKAVKQRVLPWFNSLTHVS